jgi:hypothetical protein
VVSAEGTQLILTTHLVATTADAPSFAATILAMEESCGLSQTVLADTGYASGEAVTALQAASSHSSPSAARNRTGPMIFAPRPIPGPSGRSTSRGAWP